MNHGEREAAVTADAALRFMAFGVILPNHRLDEVISYLRQADEPTLDEHESAFLKACITYLDKSKTGYQDEV